ncbi:MAG: alpha/beta hydrolase [Bacteroidota bacterium]
MRLSYEVVGSGPPVLLCHGLLGDGRLWAAVGPPLAERYRLLIPDLRGHRGTSTPDAFTLWDVADDLRHILDAEGIDEAPVVGFSMGGMAALRLTLQAPDRVAALGLLSTAARAEPVFNRLRNLTMGAVVGVAGPVPVFQPIASRLMFAPRFRTARRDVVAEAMAAYRAQEGCSLGHAIRAVFTRDSIVERLPEIDVPTRILVGNLDAMTPPVWAAELHAGIRRSTLTQLPGIGHMTPLEAPEVVGPWISELLAAHG